MALRTVLLLIALGSSAIGPVAGQGKTTIRTKVVRQELFKDQPLKLTSKLSFAWHGNVSTPPLDAGSLASVKVHVINDSGDDWDVTRADVMSSKIKPVVRDRLWNSGQSNVVELQIKVPARYPSTELRARVILRARAMAEPPFDVQVSLDIQSVIAGMVSFPHELNPVDISGDRDTFRVPILCSSEQKNLQAECSRPELVSDAKLVGDDDNKMIEFVLAKELVAESGDHCQLTVTDSRSGMSDTATLLFERPAKASVRPQTLRFTRKNDGMFWASGIVRFAKSPDESESKGKIIGKPLIEARLNGTIALKVKQHVLSPDISRVEIQLSDQASGGEAPEGGHFIQWNFINQSVRASARSPVLIANVQANRKHELSDRLEAVSRCDAWYANVQSLRQFQVYVDVRRSFLMPFSGELHENNSQMIVEADLVAKKFCFYQNNLQAVVASDESEKRVRCVKGATFDSRRFRELRCSGRSNDSVRDFKAAWRYAEIPNIHAVGIENFVTTRIFAGEEAVAEKFTTLRNPTRDWRVRVATDARSTLSMKTPRQRTIYTDVWTFDEAELVPVATKRTLEWAKGEPNAHLAPSEIYAEAIEWTTLGNGVRAPARILGRHRAFKDDPAGGAMKVYPVNYEVRFHWLSVNDEIAFDFSVPLTPADVLQRVENAKAKSEAKK